MLLKSFVAAKHLDSPRTARVERCRCRAAAVGQVAFIPRPSPCLVERTRQLIPNHLKTTLVSSCPFGRGGAGGAIFAPQPGLFCLGRPWFGWTLWWGEGPETQTDPEGMGKSERGGAEPVGWVL